jgi:hypothetical protein
MSTISPFTAATGYAWISTPYTVNAADPTRLMSLSRRMELIISDTATSTDATYPTISSTICESMTSYPRNPVHPPM